MKLVELRKLSIQKQSKIHFRLRNGMECIVSERGIAHVPALKGIPDFNLEEELAAASEFLLEPVAVPDKKSDKKSPPRPRSITGNTQACRDRAVAGRAGNPAASPDRLPWYAIARV